MNKHFSVFSMFIYVQFFVLNFLSAATEAITVGELQLNVDVDPSKSFEVNINQNKDADKNFKFLTNQLLRFYRFTNPDLPGHNFSVNYGGIPEFRKVFETAHENARKLILNDKPLGGNFDLKGHSLASFLDQLSRSSKKEKPSDFYTQDLATTGFITGIGNIVAPLGLSAKNTQLKDKIDVVIKKFFEELNSAVAKFGETNKIVVNNLFSPGKKTQRIGKIILESDSEETIQSGLGEIKNKLDEKKEKALKEAQDLQRILDQEQQARQVITDQEGEGRQDQGDNLGRIESIENARKKLQRKQPVAAPEGAMQIEEPVESAGGSRLKKVYKPNPDQIGGLGVYEVANLPMNAELSSEASSSARSSRSGSFDGVVSGLGVDPEEVDISLDPASAPFPPIQPLNPIPNVFPAVVPYDSPLAQDTLDVPAPDEYDSGASDADLLEQELKKLHEKAAIVHDRNNIVRNEEVSRGSIQLIETSEREGLEGGFRSVGSQPEAPPQPTISMEQVGQEHELSTQRDRRAIAEAQEAIERSRLDESSSVDPVSVSSGTSSGTIYSLSSSLTDEDSIPRQPANPLSFYELQRQKGRQAARPAQPDSYVQGAIENMQRTENAEREAIGVVQNLDRDLLKIREASGRERLGGGPKSVDLQVAPPQPSDLVSEAGSEDNETLMQGINSWLENPVPPAGQQPELQAPQPRDGEHGRGIPPQFNASSAQNRSRSPVPATIPSQAGSSISGSPEIINENDLFSSYSESLSETGSEDSSTPLYRANNQSRQPAAPQRPEAIADVNRDFYDLAQKTLRMLSGLSGTLSRFQGLGINLGAEYEGLHTLWTHELFKGLSFENFYHKVLSDTSKTPEQIFNDMASSSGSPSPTFQDVVRSCSDLMFGAENGILNKLNRFLSNYPSVRDRFSVGHLQNLPGVLEYFQELSQQGASQPVQQQAQSTSPQSPAQQPAPEPQPVVPSVANASSPQASRVNQSAFQMPIFGAGGGLQTHQQPLSKAPVKPKTPWFAGVRKRLNKLIPGRNTNNVVPVPQDLSRSDGLASVESQDSIGGGLEAQASQAARVAQTASQQLRPQAPDRRVRFDVPSQNNPLQPFELGGTASMAASVFGLRQRPQGQNNNNAQRIFGQGSVTQPQQPAAQVAQAVRLQQQVPQRPQVNSQPWIGPKAFGADNSNQPPLPARPVAHQMPIAADMAQVNIDSWRAPQPFGFSNPLPTALSSTLARPVASQAKPDSQPVNSAPWMNQTLGDTPQAAQSPTRVIANQPQDPQPSRQQPATVQLQQVSQNNQPAWDRLRPFGLGPLPQTMSPRLQAGEVSPATLASLNAPIDEEPVVINFSSKDLDEKFDKLCLELDVLDQNIRANNKWFKDNFKIEFTGTYQNLRVLLRDKRALNFKGLSLDEFYKKIRKTGSSPSELFNNLPSAKQGASFELVVNNFEDRLKKIKTVLVENMNRFAMRFARKNGKIFEDEVVLEDVANFDAVKSKFEVLITEADQKPSMLSRFANIFKRSPSKNQATPAPAKVVESAETSTQTASAEMSVQTDPVEIVSPRPETNVPMEDMQSLKIASGVNVLQTTRVLPAQTNFRRPVRAQQARRAGRPQPTRREFGRTLHGLESSNDGNVRNWIDAQGGKPVMKQKQAFAQTGQLYKKDFGMQAPALSSAQVAQQFAKAVVQKTQNMNKQAIQAIKTIPKNLNQSVEALKRIRHISRVGE